MDVRMGVQGEISERKKNLLSEKVRKRGDQNEMKQCKESLYA